jgi:rhamnosyltransferase
MISIIIRTHNEERWISRCLKQIEYQTFKDIEIILVDNESTDNTVIRAKNIFPEIIIINIVEFKPGLAINEGILASSGDYIVILSAHCVPINEHWLQNLYKNIQDESVAGVYGRQVPMKHTSSLDKRDLVVVFGLDKRIQKKDYFFHNANSIIRRDTWEKFPFDETVTNIEDRVWGKDVIEAGYTIIYEPEASVYHYHGIHQNNDEHRVKNVVQIMESLNLSDLNASDEITNPEKLEVAVIIPIKGDGVTGLYLKKLLQKTIEAALSAKFVNRIFVSTDNEDIAATAMELGAEIPTLRPKSLSKENVRVDEVLRFTLEYLESISYFPDIVVPMEVTTPFRPSGLIDNLIKSLLEKGLDTMVPGYAEYRIGWVKKDEEYIRIDKFDIHRSEREPIHIGLPGLGYATYPEFIRSKMIIGKRVGVFEINELLAKIEVRSKEDCQFLLESLSKFNYSN